MDDEILQRYLFHLARQYGVQTEYLDMNHRRRMASAEALVAVLKALGAPLHGVNDAPQAWRETRQNVRVLEPVIVNWDGNPPGCRISIRKNEAGGLIRAILHLETGETIEFHRKIGSLPVIGVRWAGKRRFMVCRLSLPRRPPYGYHRLVIEIGGRQYESLIISAPLKAYPLPDRAHRLWGVFLPLYALKTSGDWGAGDYSGLAGLMELLARAGAGVVSTLPLLPTFLDYPFDPSPYSPVSRLMWNEFYIDVSRSPEMTYWSPAVELVSSAEFAAGIRAMKGKSLVDYRAVMAAKRRVLEELCNGLFQSGGSRLEDFRDFVRSHPVVEKYASFRAAIEMTGKTWSGWPQPLRDGQIRAGDYVEKVKNYYLYAQWLATEQLKSLVSRARRRNIGLYFDLPLGVHPDGFDVWCEREIFVPGVSVGAPPDIVFTNGQDWGFPPLHPEKIRERGYRYVIDYLRHHLQFANILRLDHVMGLHRLFWIPRGISPAGGIYVRYHSEELYAILALESHRYRCAIAGEDLGIVPSYVRPAMARHGLYRMYILRFELADSEAKTLRRIPRRSVASLNTHDMPPFAAFWEGKDILEKKALGLVDEEGARQEAARNQYLKDALVAFLRKNGFLLSKAPGTHEVLSASLAFLASGPAGVVIVNLEDLWQETESQNVPGTGDRRPNWQRKARFALEEIAGRREVNALLATLDEMRLKGRD